MNRVAAIAVLLWLSLTSAGPPELLERVLREAATRAARGDLVAAGAAADQALRLAEERGDQTSRVRAQRQRGVVLDAMGRAAEARAEFERARATARRLADPVAEAAVLRDQGLGHWRRAEYADAERLALESLARVQPAGDRAVEGAARDLLARIALKQGRLPEALRGFQRARVDRREAGDTPGEAESHLGLVATLLEQREFDRALAEARDLGARAGARHDRDLVVESLVQSAIVWLFQRAPDEALRELRRARRLAEDPYDASLVARVLHHEAGALLARGEHARALEAHDGAIAAYRVLGNQREVAWNLARRARSLEALHRDADAEASLGRALDLWHGMGDLRALAFWTHVRAQMLDRLARPDEAWSAWRQARALQQEIGLPYGALVLSEMAWAAARGGAPDRARALAAEAVEEAHASGIPEMLWTAHYRRGLVERRCGSREEALRALREGLDVVERMRARVVQDDEALIGFLEDKQGLFAETVDLLMELGRAGEAFEVAERSRSRALLDLLREQAPERAPPTALPALDDLVREVRRRGVTVVEYFTAADRTFAWVVAPHGAVRAWTFPFGAGALVRRVGATRHALARSADPGTGDGALREARLLSRGLHRDLWQPMAACLPRNPEAMVTVVPHGALHLLPFAGLVDGEGAYLLERHTLAYAPSVAALRARAAHAGRPDTHGGLLAVGCPVPLPREAARWRLSDLPDAAGELAAAAAAFGEARVLVGDMATEAAVRDLLPSSGAIHFATHAVLRDDEPREGFLALAPSGAHRDHTDGALSVREVLDLSLHAQLVTLSACDTGVGPLSGEGVLGFCRAFLHAGVETVVVSLWAVADRVGRYQMDRFYRALRSGEGRAAALRHAQIDTLAALRRGEIRTASGRMLPETPLFWAPFVLVGEGGEPVRLLARSEATSARAWPGR